MGLFSCFGAKGVQEGTNRISNTKYTLWTFVPLNLWQQVSQAMNKYFILIACLQLWSSITPVAPITTWGPLAVIFAISGLKEAIDDTKRYRNDNLANERMVTVLRDGRRQQIQSQQLLVGDVVYITEDEEFPADLVLLRSSEAKTGSCYIQTSNIDGETNLKQRFAAHKEYTQQLEESQMYQLDVVVECATPNNNIYNFNSTLKLPSHWKQQVSRSRSVPGAVKGGASSGSVETEFPLSGDNLLLQATFLRNTCWIYGLVVYAGNSSKVGCNKSKPEQKYTKVDETINRVTVVVFLTQLTMILMWGLLGYHEDSIHHTQSVEPARNGGWWYLVYEYDRQTWITPLIIPLRFLLLASMMIPISLKVSLDVIKLYYSMCINWDLHLYDAAQDEPAKATNTSIAENLGQVAYVLTDKTGTLTENVMVFRKLAVVGGKRYGDHRRADRQQGQQQRTSTGGVQTPRASSASSPLTVEEGVAPSDDDRILADPVLLQDLDAQDESLVDLLRFMALCNTVVPSWIGGKPSSLRPTAYSDAGACSSPSSSSSSVTVTPGTSMQSTTMAAQQKKLSLEMVASLPMSDGGASKMMLSPEPLFTGGVGGSADDDHDGPPVASSKKAKKKAAAAAAAAAARNSKRVALLADDDLPSDSVLLHHPELDRGASVTQVGLTPSASYQNDRPAGVDRQVSYTPTASKLTRQHSQSIRVAAGSVNVASSITAGSGDVGNVHYASSSPDELSLVEFAASVGVRLLEKEGSILRLHVDPRVRIGGPAGAAGAASGAGSPSIQINGGAGGAGGGLSFNSPSPTPVRVTEEWEVLRVLEFSSERKRMSVVLRQLSANGGSGAGQIYLYTKGADDVIFARMRKSSGLVGGGVVGSQQSTFRSTLDSYASHGLRTLCFASRVVPAAEYAEWSEKLHAANLDIHSREAKLAEAYDLLERDLGLIGCSGIEDRLQRHVPETISELRAAGIKVWMLTGDRWATALEISKSCALYRPRAIVRDSAVGGAASAPASPPSSSGEGDLLYAIEGVTPEDVRRSLDAALQRAIGHAATSGAAASASASASTAPYCLIVDGAILPILLSPDVEARFALLALRAVSVICARTTPSQKACMVQLVKKYSRTLGGRIDPADLRRILAGGDSAGVCGGLGGPSTGVFSFLTSLFRPSGQVVLAIGDGGNDVSMIQVSDVGVGIVGKEGLQASRAADYSFVRFECLTRLLLVHGRYAYSRTAFVAQYCFFKSMLICLVQLFYAFGTDWSGASYFDSYSLVTYNLFYTSLPTLLFVLEQDLSPAMLLANPRLYRTSQRGSNLTFGTLVGWLARALVQAILLIAYANHTKHGDVAAAAFGFQGQISNALVIYTACVFIHPLTIYLESTYITRLHHLILGGTVVLFVVLNCLLAVLSPHMDLWHVYLVLLADREYYLRVLLVTVTCMVPVLAFKYVQTRYYPSEVQVAHRAELTAGGLLAKDPDDGGSGGENSFTDALGAPDALGGLGGGTGQYTHMAP